MKNVIDFYRNDMFNEIYLIKTTNTNNNNNIDNDNSDYK